MPTGSNQELKEPCEKKSILARTLSVSKSSIPHLSALSINLLCVLFAFAFLVDVRQTFPYWEPKDWEVTILMGGLGMKAVYEGKRK